MLWFFGINNSSLRKSKNYINNFLIFGENSVGVSKESSVSIVSNFTQNFVLSLRYNGDKSSFLVNKTKIYQFKTLDSIN